MLTDIQALGSNSTASSSLTSSEKILTWQEGLWMVQKLSPNILHMTIFYGDWQKWKKKRLSFKQPEKNVFDVLIIIDIAIRSKKHTFLLFLWKFDIYDEGQRCFKLRHTALWVRMGFATRTGVKKPPLAAGISVLNLELLLKFWI